MESDTKGKKAKEEGFQNLEDVEGGVEEFRE